MEDHQENITPDAQVETLGEVPEKTVQMSDPVDSVMSDAEKETVALEQKDNNEPVKDQQTVREKLVNNLGGWLVVYVFYFACAAILSASIFFRILIEEASTPSVMPSLIFLPIVSVSSTTAVVLIAMRKKIAIKASLAAIGAPALYAIVNSIINNGEGIFMVIGSIVTTLIGFGLLGLYFIFSERVKATFTR